MKKDPGICTRIRGMKYDLGNDTNESELCTGCVLIELGSKSIFPQKRQGKNGILGQLFRAWGQEFKDQIVYVAVDKP